jgi:Peptidase family M28
VGFPGVGVAEVRLRVTEVGLGDTDMRLLVTEVEVGDTEVRLLVTEVEVGDTEVRLLVAEVEVGDTDVTSIDGDARLNEIRLPLDPHSARGRTSATLRAMPVPPRAALARALVTLAALAALAFLGLAWTRPPPPAPAAEFSSARALAHVAVIARHPHPMGSTEHAAVRAYLLSQLRAVGLEPEVHEAVVTDGTRAPARFATVKNVVARRKGTRGEGKALLLMAHYDSRSATPGAADDSMCVAAVLETARALEAGPPLASDVIFLLTDGEEMGLLGARAFVAGDPWAAEVGLVLNFDARGDRGAALMFQTSEGNGALIRELAAAAPHVSASSLLADVYRRMHNDTDLTAWLARAPAVQGLNFANLGGFERYHAPTDTVENLSERTLEQHGSYALALSRAFGDRALPLPPEPDAVFFGVGPFFVHYPGALTLPLAAATLILAALFFAIGRREGVVTARGAGIAFAFALVAVASGAVLGAIALSAARALRGAVIAQTPASPGMKDFYYAAFIALGVAAALALCSRLLRTLRAAEVFLGGAALWTMLAMLSAIYLPGGAFLFTWPALVALIVGIALVRAGLSESDAPLAAALAVLAAAPVIVVMGPYVGLFCTTFGLAAAPIVGGLSAAIASLVAPAARVLLGAGRRAVPLAAFGLALAAFVTGTMRPAWSPRFPRPDTLIYALDRDALKGFWLSTDSAPDAFTSAFLDGAEKTKTAPLPFPMGGDRTLLVKAATTAPEPGPEIVWGDETTAGEGRTIRLRVVPPRGAHLLAIQVDAGVASARVQGRAAPVDGGRLSILYSGPPEGGVEIELATASRAPVTARAMSARGGFPEGVTPGPRPATLMAKPGLSSPRDELYDSDATLVAVSATR